MKIIITRHGQTDLNMHKKVQGRTNAKLNDTGLKEAKLIGRKLKKYSKEIKAVYSSSLDRAYETGLIALKEMDLNQKIIKTDHFMERDFYDYEKLDVDIMVEAFNNPFSYNPDKRFESLDEMASRIFYKLEKLYEKHKNETILIFAHSHVIKTILLKTKLGDPIFSKVLINQCETFIINIDDKMNYHVLDRLSIY